MHPDEKSKPRVLVDADVLFAAAASPSEHSASLLVLRLAELTLIDAVVPKQVVTEAERNLQEKLPGTASTMRLLVGRCLQVVDDPLPMDLVAYEGRADAKDLSILVAAAQMHCTWLVTFNVRHYQPGISAVRVVRPGDFILRVRGLLAHLVGNT